MGGRGSGSGGIPTGHPGGGGGNKPEYQQNAVGFQPYDTLKDALGEKGKPMGEARATLDANPHHSYDYGDFSLNCQRCVVAYEARRRGYDVTAQPSYEGDTMGSQVYTNPRTKVHTNRWMGAFQGAKPERTGGSADPAKAQAKFENKLASYGEGARGIMQVQWADGSGGHVLNVEYRNGKVHYNDAQVGVKYTGKELFRKIKTRDTQLVRTDNLRFSNRAKDMVTKDKW